MLSVIKTISLIGLKGNIVEIQTDISNGIPHFEIVGLPDIRVKEAKERVKSAIKNSGMEFPNRKIIINLAPADIRKEGTYFDLPIAIGILTAIGIINEIAIKDFIFLGELSLNGRINGVSGVLPMCLEAKEFGIKKAILPNENIKEASIIKDLDIIPVSSLKEVVEYLNGKIIIKNNNYNKFNIKTDFYKNYYGVDFSEIKGQEYAKRALEIATTRIA